MILTDYYRLEHLEGGKSALRMDCTASTQSYNPLECLRNKSGELFVYLGRNNHTKPGQSGKADLAISRTKHISSIYVPNPSTRPSLGYGDYPNTSDALIFVLSGFQMANAHPADGAVLDVYVARGYSKNINGLYNIVADGELDAEMEMLRSRAVHGGKEVEAVLF